jgi:hypothetical protein
LANHAALGNAGGFIQETNHENYIKQGRCRRFRSTKFRKVQKQKAQTDRQTVGETARFERRV